MTHYTPLFIHIESDVKWYKYMYGTFCEMSSHQEYKKMEIEHFINAYLAVQISR